jgi:hypothetical protein
MPIRTLETRRPPEVGRIRLGVFERGHPTQAETFIFTSADPGLLHNLAVEFGGTVSEYVPQGSTQPSWRLVSESDVITALLPFANAGENIDQWMEQWGSLGIKRRCDGNDVELTTITEATGEIRREQVPCICRAEGRMVCQPVTRLRVWLPQSGAIGIWLLQTHSKVALYGLDAVMRQMEDVADGALHRLPVRLVYEPRALGFTDAQGKRRKVTKRVLRMVPVATPEMVVALAEGTGSVREALAEVVPGRVRALGSGVGSAVSPTGAGAVIGATDTAPAVDPAALSGGGGAARVAPAPEPMSESGARSPASFQPDTDGVEGPDSDSLSDDGSVQGEGTYPESETLGGGDMGASTPPPSTIQPNQMNHIFALATELGLVNGHDYSELKRMLKPKGVDPKSWSLTGLTEAEADKCIAFLERKRAS